jgi:hypothetical protein
MLSAKELLLPKKVVEALIAIRDELRDGKYPHRSIYSGETWSPISYGFNPQLPPDTEVYFNMVHWSIHSREYSRPYRICCIGGLVEQRTGYRMRGDFDFQQHQLCYPGGIPDRQITESQVRLYNKITPDQAADAIDNFLYEGDPQWGRVLT